jgi:hypothetical protein
MTRGHLGGGLLGPSSPLRPPHARLQEHSGSAVRRCGTDSTPTTRIWRRASKRSAIEETLTDPKEATLTGEEATDADDAWLAVHVVGAMLVRLENRL